MSTPTSCAGYLRGGLVGVSSALVTGLAHSLAGGEPPSGSAVMFLVVVCAAMGIAGGGVTAEGRYSRVGLVIAALCAGQLLGHLVLAFAGGQHGECGWMLTGPMVAVHATAAICLGVAISVVEYLHAVGASVLCWLRLYVTGQIRPAIRITRRRPSNVVVVGAVLLRAGLGMRAPPAVPLLGA